MAICPTCHGDTCCSLCDGTGRIQINPHPSNPYIRTDGSGTSTCYLCNGSGKCPTCGGSGRVYRF